MAVDVCVWPRLDLASPHTSAHADTPAYMEPLCGSPRVLTAPCRPLGALVRIGHDGEKPLWRQSRRRAVARGHRLRLLARSS